MVAARAQHHAGDEEEQHAREAPHEEQEDEELPVAVQRSHLAVVLPGILARAPIGSVEAR